MARKGKEFEEAYKNIYELDRDRYTITSPAYLYDIASDSKREVDVLIEYKDREGVNRKIIVECRDRKKVQDVIWLDQLQQKKEDLNVDYVLAATTSSFTKPALRKAAYHGIIVETAELFRKETIESNISEFFCDIFFLKFQLIKLTIFSKKRGICSLKEYLENIDIISRDKLLFFIQNDMYLSIEPNTLLDKHSIDESSFFSSKDNSIIMKHLFETNIFFKNMYMSDIEKIGYEVKLVPHKLSLPLDKSISSFYENKNANKKYRAIFGEEELEFVEIGYLDDKVYINTKLLPREHSRIIGGRLNINTIFPEKTILHSDQLDRFLENNSMGKFDLSRVL